MAHFFSYFFHNCLLLLLLLLLLLVSEKSPRLECDLEQRTLSPFSPLPFTSSSSSPSSWLFLRAYAQTADAIALRALYRATNFGEWKSSCTVGWDTVLTDLTPCNLPATPYSTYFGIQCGGTNGNRVVRVGLNDCNLQGTLPPELGLLDKVEILYLQRNRLFGTLPNAWVGMNSVIYLQLQQNFLSGTMPVSWQSAFQINLADEEVLVLFRCRQ